MSKSKRRRVPKATGALVRIRHSTRWARSALGDWPTEWCALERKCEEFAPTLLENGEPLSVFEQGVCHGQSHLWGRSLWQGQGDEEGPLQWFLGQKDDQNQCQKCRRGEFKRPLQHTVGRTSQLSRWWGPQNCQMQFWVWAPVPKRIVLS